MTAPRRRRGRPAQSQHPADAPLPGYLCELCQDAPAVQWQPTPEGEERGVCGKCGAEEHGEEPRESVPWPS